MKKLLIVLGLMLASIAHAESGVEFETGSENGTFKPSPATVRNNWIAITPWTEWGDGWDAGLKFEGARDVTPGATLENKIEARIRKSVNIGNGFGAGFRVGLGRDFNSTADFNYYIVEPRVTYELTSKATAVVSYRYRNAFGKGYYFESNTYKEGIDYKITSKDEVGFRILQKRGADEISNGVEVTYSRSF
jgi:hypothetical protein